MRWRAAKTPAPKEVRNIESFSRAIRSSMRKAKTKKIIFAKRDETPNQHPNLGCQLTRGVKRQNLMRKRRSRAKKRRERKRPSAVVAIYQEAAEVDKLINDANSDAPANETRRLLRVEEHCRGLEDGFGRGNLSLMRATVLIGFDGKQIWPIKQSIDPAFYQLDGRRTAFDCSGDWWRPNSEQQKLKQEQQILEKAQARVDRDSFYGLNGRKF